jgi:HD-like signal output (HDOD) protein
MGPVLLTESEILRVAEVLPTAPRLLVELGHLMHQPHVQSDDVVALLRQDPPLVAQIIRMANSAAYAPSEPVGSLERALLFIGFAEVHRLVGLVATEQLADQRMRLFPVDSTKLRLNALFTAVVMEELAKWTRESPRSCYTVGLLRTMGMMALERLAPSDGGIPAFLESGETVLDAWEEKYWGITNVEAAEKILLRWRLPNETVAAIRHHSHPTGHHNPIIHLLTLASSAAASFYGIPGEESYWQLTSENFDQSGLDPACFPIVCRKAQHKFEQLKIMVA